jgi:hypothetical protein
MKFDITKIDPSLLVADQDDERYADSLFRDLKKMHAKQKGKRYEKITENVLKTLGFKVGKPLSSDHDRLVNDKKVEIKGSTLNKGTDHFSFLQIRPDQDYESIYFVMFYPHQLVVMEMTKDQIVKQIDAGVFKKQHGGNKAESRTFLYYGNRETLTALGASVIVE